MKMGYFGTMIAFSFVIEELLKVIYTISKERDMPQSTPDTLRIITLDKYSSGDRKYR